jgi:L-threonylcarbamoyladenylate synthase
LGRGEGSAPVRPTSPGMLESHYAPGTPLRLLAQGALASYEPRPQSAALLFDVASFDALGHKAALYREVRVLSKSGDLIEAAAGLFAVLHELDGLGLKEIVAERVPERGLGRAINDRLMRAQAKR